jgi:hypothetical protein
MRAGSRYQVQRLPSNLRAMTKAAWACDAGSMGLQAHGSKHAILRALATGLSAMLLRCGLHLKKRERIG